MAVKTYTQGEAVTCGVVVENLLREQENPANGVKVTIKNPSDATMVDAQACVQGQWDEKNPIIDGQYYYVYQLANDAPVGEWPVIFEINPAGVYKGRGTGSFKVVT